MPLFTIFTGTYNSANVIQRVFQSLEEQTCKDFEWIVIDDCSTDDTVQLVEGFLKTHPSLKARLVRHTANTGVGISRREALEQATGKYFITWDHDDAQQPDQLQVFADIWQRHDRPSVANIYAKVKNQHGKTLGRLFPRDGYVSDYISLHNDYLVGNLDKGNAVEHHVCFRRDRFLEVQQHFQQRPELTGGFFPAGGDFLAMLAWMGYQTVCTNHVVRTYYVAESGRSSMSSGTRKNKAARIYHHKLLWVNYFNHKLPAGEWKWRLRSVFAALMYGLLSGKTFTQVLSSMRGWADRLWAVCLILPARIMAGRYARE
jgi:glycosyltransferase involved in cell wall biosynthesis